MLNRRGPALLGITLWLFFPAILIWLVNFLIFFFHSACYLDWILIASWSKFLRCSTMCMNMRGNPHDSHYFLSQNKSLQAINVSGFSWNLWQKLLRDTGYMLTPLLLDEEHNFQDSAYIISKRGKVWSPTWYELRYKGNWSLQLLLYKE